MTNLQTAARALLKHWDSLQTADLADAEASIEALRQALQEPDTVAQAAEREAIMDEWWMCVQSDLEHGVKSLNEQVAEKWKKEYPAIAGFAAKINARGE